MKKYTSKFLSKEDRKAYDYHWQHVRRNSSYRQYYSSRMRANPRVVELEAIRQKRALTKSEKDELLQVASQSQETPGGTSGALHWIPNPDITDSHDAMQIMLAKCPTYFQLPLWQKIRLNPFGPAAIWAPRGDGGDGRVNKPPLSQIGTDLQRAIFSLRLTEEYLKVEFPTEDSWVARESKKSGRTVKEQRALWRKEREQEITTIRKLLTEHPQMNFALDTSLRFGSVVKYLEAQWELVKDLRKYVGLQRDVRPLPLRPQWEKQLAVWDKVRKLQPQGAPKFTNKFLKKLQPAKVNKLNDAIGMKRISASDYKRKMDKLRSEIRDAFLAAEKAISEAVR